jgi:hypothetical protein
VNCSLRRSSLLLLWLLLALLPLRGWAHLSMHLTAPDLSVMAPCHGAEAAADSSASTPPCTLCDICHGAVLPWADSPAPSKDRRAQALPAAASRAAPPAEPDALFRPPRR